MRFEIFSTYHPKPFEPNDFIQSMEISIKCSTPTYEEAVAGRVAVDALSIQRVEDSGTRLLDVCDGHSDSWTHVYEAIIEPAPDFRGIRQDIEFDEPIHDIVFIRQAVFHPALKEWQQLIIDAICGMFSDFSAVVMMKRTTDMTDRELAGLGFRIVAGWETLFRPNMLAHPYQIANDEREATDELVVPDDAQDYVEERWDDE